MFKNSYDFKILKTANEILKGDNYELGKNFQSQKAKGLKPTNVNCYVCDKDLSSSESNELKVRIFECGHAYHYYCIQTLVDCPRCDDKEIYYRYDGTKTDKKSNRNIEISERIKIERLQKVEEILYQTSNLPLYQNLIEKKNDVVLKFSKGKLIF
jgi:hypothetical protein